MALIDYGYAPGDNSAAPHSTQSFAIHSDHLGTPQAITDEQQRVVWMAQYDAFGRASVQGLPSNSGVPFAFHLRFAGQYEDTETGWHYNWHRFYDPDTGRYLTPDPIGLRGGDNAFGYAGGDPLGAVDPWGLYTVYWGGAGLNGAYIEDQIGQFENAGISNIAAGGGGNGNTILDATNVLTVRYQGNGSRYFDSDPESRKMMCPEQTNYIGYSYGSLLAAHTAMYWANQGRMIDNLVLIGSPIDADFLAALRTNSNIRNLLVYDLTLYGDPIHAGMTLAELTASVPVLGLQISQDPRSGHFYYNPDDAATSSTGIARRGSLATNLARSGLR
ncbi:MAG: RHS domain-containing protein [Hydrogenophaga sp.]|uniref:RHS repeat-associated core domain-containing protein n=2 Tax=Hydrogenophaga sp. TaxID=1904254 RepID=UPI001DC88943|nr:RHS repeat-associated core domain-containing protein [Hydrogenophaga sp.]MBW0171538.1 RHS domain-containing protein [Hydrogenophaga sp.]MBW0182871.1 RHS domain-containing protein [Hydrogenophaga sp.]